MANLIHTTSSHTTTPSTEYEEGEVIPFQQEQREWTRSIFPPYPHNIPFSTTSFSISFSSSLEYVVHHHHPHHPHRYNPTINNHQYQIETTDLIPPLPGSHVPLSWFKFTRPKFNKIDIRPKMSDFPPLSPTSSLLQQHLDNQSLTRSNSSKVTRSLTPLPHPRSSSVTSLSSSSSSRETQMEQMIQEQQKQIEHLCPT